MPKDLKDFPRPPSDNGRGLHGSASSGWSGGGEGYDFWIGELVSMGVKWVKVVDSGGDSLEFCEHLLAAGVFPIVRVLRRDPPPNDAPEPNPGHINATEEETIRRLVAAGVRYFETNNEPDVPGEWKNGAIPGDPIETAKLVALNWLFDARFILAAGGLPGLPAISSGGSMDLMGALISLGRQDILLEGCWIALHNYSKNLPIDYPEDPVNRNGAPLTTAEYDQGAFTLWAWWNNAVGRADTLDEVNSMRSAGKNPDETIQHEHACFREFEFYNSLAMKYLGRSIPIISTECGYSIGRREDGRYARVTPDAHRDSTVALFDYMQRQAPDYYFAAVPWLMPETQGMEMDAWYSSFWKRTLQSSSTVRDGIPPIAVAGLTLGNRLPVIEAVKQMSNLARRMPGVQPPPPPVQVTAAPQPARHAPLKYVVVGTDTIAKIAKQFGTAASEIVALNRLASPDSIQPGQVLLIPRAGESPVTETPKPESAPRPARAEAGLAALFPEPDLPAPAPAPSPQAPGAQAEAATMPAPLATPDLPPAPPRTSLSPEAPVSAPSTASPQPAPPAVQPPTRPASAPASPQTAAPAFQPATRPPTPDTPPAVRPSAPSPEIPKPTITPA
ncbi:MAG: LysM peptidoglycan-binding domain-containing protein [Chloroflexi bacterium]|nr:LysM peptidoglycan-binding domain-containing protein [Chloroflexota bacterium]